MTLSALRGRDPGGGEPGFLPRTLHTQTHGPLPERQGGLYFVPQVPLDASRSPPSHFTTILLSAY